MGGKLSTTFDFVQMTSQALTAIIVISHYFLLRVALYYAPVFEAILTLGRIS